MHSNNEIFKTASSLDREQALQELKELYLKGQLSFTTILSVREIFTQNLEYKCRILKEGLKSPCIHKSPKVIPLFG
ncbi:hypothetical protein HCG49_17090 [Arenibacter sp. 6A1]|uniref:hypothetical protein n=1 Tax=Arenibacter sp. 6A1 TaxID=2720391 RepID=UPI001447783E|nr:hypothetical protein [Arenibacter sp. 6A1]NKI28272.1 hypothetical protein [Arenibacter sp. 6A1]